MPAQKLRLAKGRKSSFHHNTGHNNNNRTSKAKNSESNANKTLHHLHPSRRHTWNTKIKSMTTRLAPLLSLNDTEMDNADLECNASSVLGDQKHALLESSPTKGNIKTGKEDNKRIKLILGSGSTSRRAILESAGLRDFDVIIPDVDEKEVGKQLRDNHLSTQLVAVIAEAKADSILQRISSSTVLSSTETNAEYILLTGDSVVTYNGKIREKPSTLEEAKEFIRSYSRNKCSTVSAVCLQNLKSGEREVSVHKATVYFKEIPLEVVDILCKDKEVLRCAGGLMVEHPQVQPFISKIEGGIDSVMGLDIDTVVQLLQKVTK